MQNGQGPPNDLIARFGNPVDESDRSADELIEDVDVGGGDGCQPPAIHCANSNEDDELGMLRATGTPVSPIGTGTPPGKITCAEADVRL